MSERRTFIASVASLIGGIFVGRTFRIGPFDPQNGIGTSSNPFTDKLAAGPLDDMNSNFLWCRQQVAKTLQAAFPGYSTCGRCGFPWAIAKSKDIPSGPHSGIFAICRDCWDELQVAELRKPYYLALLKQQHESWLGYKNKYPDSPDPMSEWSTVEASIESNKNWP